MVFPLFHMMKRLDGDWKPIQEVYSPPLPIYTDLKACQDAWLVSMHSHYHMYSTFQHIYPLLLCMALNKSAFIYYISSMLGTWSIHIQILRNFMFVVILINGKCALFVHKYTDIQGMLRTARGHSGHMPFLGTTALKSLVTHNHLPHVRSVTKPTTVVMVLYRTLW